MLQPQKKTTGTHWCKAHFFKLMRRSLRESYRCFIYVKSCIIQTCMFSHCLTLSIPYHCADFHTYNKVGDFQPENKRRKKIPLFIFRNTCPFIDFSWTHCKKKSLPQPGRRLCDPVPDWWRSTTLILLCSWISAVQNDINFGDLLAHLMM